VLEPGGVLVSTDAAPDQQTAARLGVEAGFVLVAITADGLSNLANLFDSGELKTNVGEIMPLDQARVAHEMLAGKPHNSGKIVSQISG
jgi:NADPH:quinone reductase-like Zn-dependent oxidoreductase